MIDGENAEQADNSSCIEIQYNMIKHIRIIINTNIPRMYFIFYHYSETQLHACITFQSK